MFSRFFLICTIFCLSGLGHAAKSVDLHELSLTQIQAKLLEGDITLQTLVDHYMSRIRQFDKAGPKLNSVARISPDLDKQINRVQTKINQSEALGTLFGAVILVKDNVDIDTMPNTAGSWLLRDHVPRDSAFHIQQLVAQDALILGKSNLSEWANFRSSDSSSGWSSLYGQTLNAHDPLRSPCGSSSGSGTAVAAGFSLLAVATETDGSIVCPAAVNGIVGFKPTLGLVSRDGIIPIAHSQDTAGAMARSVSDAVFMLEAMMGKDSSDAASLDPITLSDHLKINGLAGKRIGVVSSLMGYNDALDAIFNEQISLIKQAGATVVEDLTLERNWGSDEYFVLKAEFKADLNDYFEKSGAPIKSLKQAIELNAKDADKTMSIFDQDIFIESQSMPSLNSEEYKEALARSKKKAGQDGIDALLKAHNLDLLIAPTTAPSWLIDHILGDNFQGSASSAAAVAGYPHITVPMGFVRHMPVNISFFAGKLAEPVLVEAAYSFEQLTKARRTPVL